MGRLHEGSPHPLPDGDDRPGRRCTNGKPSYPQGPDQPAVCMDHDEARAYVAWLSKKTGKHYRLLSEAEREYAARAGSEGPFPFPFDEGKDYSIAQHANTYGAADGFNYTSPAGSFPANAFGVYDMHGNVYEWVADCLHDSYVGAPSDGSAWRKPTASTATSAATTTASRRSSPARATATTASPTCAATGWGCGWRGSCEHYQAVEKLTTLPLRR